MAAWQWVAGVVLPLAVASETKPLLYSLSRSRYSQAKAEAELRRVADSLDVIHVVIEEAVHLLTKDALGPCTVQHHIPAYLVAGEVAYFLTSD